MSRTILITGAAGSIGTALVENFSHSQKIKLILLDRNENALFLLKEKTKKSKTNIEFFIGDILDKTKLSFIFQHSNIDYVIHCAAYKQVPIMESNVYELIKNNIEGLLNVINISLSNNVKKFLFVSTDKAVYPSSMMGLTKRTGEVIIEHFNKREILTKLFSLRLSNLLESNGSVIPLFEEQIKKFSEIYLTSNKAKRFFISNEELIELVDFALSYNGKNSLLIGTYNKERYIKDLAKEFLLDKGYKNFNSLVKYTGLREGEKIKETLYYNYEKRANDDDKIKELEMNIKVKDNFLDQISNLITINSPDKETKLKELLKMIMNNYI